MRKILCFILCLIFVFSLTACSRISTRELLTDAFDKFPERFSVKLSGRGEFNLSPMSEQAVLPFRGMIWSFACTTNVFDDGSVHGLLKFENKNSRNESSLEFVANNSSRTLYWCLNGDSWNRIVFPFDTGVDFLTDWFDRIDDYSSVEKLNGGFVCNVSCSYVVESLLNMFTSISDNASDGGFKYKDDDVLTSYNMDVVNMFKGFVDGNKLKVFVNDDHVFTSAHVEEFEGSFSGSLNESPVKMSGKFRFDLKIDDLDSQSTNSVVFGDDGLPYFADKLRLIVENSPNVKENFDKLADKYGGYSLLRGLYDEYGHNGYDFGFFQNKKYDELVSIMNSIRDIFGVVDVYMVPVIGETDGEDVVGDVDSVDGLSQD